VPEETDAPERVASAENARDDKARADAGELQR
jgi:hypothetical protein